MSLQRAMQRYLWCTTHERLWDQTRDCPCCEFPLFSCHMEQATGQQKWEHAWQPLDALTVREGAE